jgi:polysaccharide biosynthesis protein PslG
MQRASARAFARFLAVALLVLALLAPEAATAVAAGTPNAGAAAKAHKKKSSKKHKRKKHHKRKKCKRYRKVRVKRHGHRKTVKRCVRKKKAPSQTGTGTPGGSACCGAPVQGGLIYGLNSINPDDASLSTVSSAGVTMSRYNMHWRDVSPSPGTFKWSGYDYVFEIMARHGVTILPEIIDDPSWAESSSLVIPSNPAAYADFTAHAVARYGPNGDFWRSHPSVPYHPAVYWELWNEPWWYGYNESGADPGTYARLVRAAAAAGYAANPGARFLLEADLTGYPNPDTQVEWIDKMYQAVPDLNSWFSGVSVHPYSYPRSPDVYSAGGDNRWNFRRIADIRAKFVAHGGADKGLWITEVGFPTCPSDSQCVSESTQASYLSRIFQMLKTDYSSFVQAVFVYNFKDPTSQDPSNIEDWFGLMHGNGSGKPAWNVLRAATGAG